MVTAFTGRPELLTPNCRYVGKGIESFNPSQACAASLVCTGLLCLFCSGRRLFSPLRPPVTDAKSVCIDRSSPPNRFTMKPAGPNWAEQVRTDNAPQGCKDTTSLQFATACPSLRILPRSRSPEAGNWLPSAGRRCTSKSHVIPPCSNQVTSRVRYSLDMSVKIRPNLRKDFKTNLCACPKFLSPGTER